MNATIHNGDHNTQVVIAADARTILLDCIDRHKPVGIYLCFSGGYDSLVCTHLSLQILRDAGVDVPVRVLHINTGIGIEKTRQFVRDTCAGFEWPLLEVRAKEDCGQDYEALVIEQGFPGPAHHDKMYQRLKERGVRLALKRAKVGHHRNSRALFVSGIRAEESEIRMGYGRTESKVRAQVWVNPCYYWTGQDQYDYRIRHDLPRNPVKDLLGISGECLCGAFAHKGEKALIRLIEPETADRIERLEAEVRAAGHPWGWEEAPSPYLIRERRGQMNAFHPLCVGCEKIHQDRVAA